MNIFSVILVIVVVASGLATFAFAVALQCAHFHFVLTVRSREHDKFNAMNKRLRFQLSPMKKYRTFYAEGYWNDAVAESRRCRVLRIYRVLQRIGIIYASTLLVLAAISVWSQLK